MFTYNGQRRCKVCIKLLLLSLLFYYYCCCYCQYFTNVVIIVISIVIIVIIGVIQLRPDDAVLAGGPCGATVVCRDLQGARRHRL